MTALAPITSQTDTAPINLIGLSREELTTQLVMLGEKPFRTKQIWHWIYHQGVTEFAAMTTLSKSLRDTLQQHFSLERPTISTHQHSSDGTQKWLLKFADCQEIETVHIPDIDRGALCVSSQVGCTLTCTFCHTGTQQLVRNLTAPEIVGQFILAKDQLNDWPASKEQRRLSSIVMMGMGEPLFNYDNVAKALTILMDPEGIALSRRRITLSTSGVVPQIEQCGKELGVNLAISLHAVRNDLRDEIVPLNRKYPIEELLDVCRRYYHDRSDRKITIEYVMLAGVNDSLSDARELVRILKGIHAKVNLIPFNPWPGAPYSCSTDKHIQAFSDLIRSKGLVSTIRTPRGKDILAACGQLKSESQRKPKYKRKGAGS